MQAQLLPTDFPLSPFLIAERQAVFGRVGISTDAAANDLRIEGRYPLVTETELRWLLGVPGGRLEDPDGARIAWHGAGNGPSLRCVGRAVTDGWTQALAERDLMRAHVRRLCNNGVKVIDPERIWIDASVEVAPGAILWPDVVLRGATRVAAGAEIQAGCWLIDTTVAAAAVIAPHSVCDRATIGAGAHVGPMAHLRPGAQLERDVKVGNFVEVKNTLLRAGAKASHLTYLGDADIGEEANIGAGTITCNYDGYGKHRTTVGARAFVGSNTSLVAPIAVGSGAIIGAGSVISEDVPPESLAVERSEQRILRDKAPRIRARNARRAGKEP